MTTTSATQAKLDSAVRNITEATEAWMPQAEVVPMPVPPATGFVEDLMLQGKALLNFLHAPLNFFRTPPMWSRDGRPTDTAEKALVDNVNVLRDIAISNFTPPAARAEAVATLLERGLRVPTHLALLGTSRAILDLAEDAPELFTPEHIITLRQWLADFSPSNHPWAPSKTVDRFCFNVFEKMALNNQEYPFDSIEELERHMTQYVVWGPTRLSILGKKNSYLVMAKANILAAIHYILDHQKNAVSIAASVPLVPKEKLTFPLLDRRAARAAPSQAPGASIPAVIAEKRKPVADPREDMTSLHNKMPLWIALSNLSGERKRPNLDIAAAIHVVLEHVSSPGLPLDARATAIRQAVRSSRTPGLDVALVRQVRRARTAIALRQHYGTPNYIARNLHGVMRAR